MRLQGRRGDTIVQNKRFDQYTSLANVDTLRGMKMIVLRGPANGFA